MVDTEIAGPRKLIRILVVDDHPLVREGMAALLSKEPDFEVCGEAGDAGAAMRFVLQEKPDLVIVDISLQSGNGIELIKQIKAQNENVRMVVSSMHEEALFAERALRAGAMGYVHKQEPRRRLIDAIHCVLEGKIYLSDAMKNRMLSRTLGKGEDVQQSPIDALSDREVQVFELIGHGLTVRQIAEKLQLSPKTVETYRENIKAKLDLANATELTRHAVQWVLESK